MLLFIVGLQQQAWSDEYPSPPDADMPAVSPDGKKIVFESDNITRKTTIWIANRNGEDAHPLVNWPESVQIDPDWSPDGQYVVFASNRDSQNKNIWRVNADGSNPIKLTSEGDNNYPKFSPDGTKILFTTKRIGNRGLWYISVDGSGQRTAGLPAEITSDRSWSPDGNALVYSKCAGIPKSGSWQDMECNLFTYRFDTGAIKQLTFGKADDSSPDWGALGIVFDSKRNKSYGIWMVDDTGNNLRQITTNDDLNLDPRWDHTTDTIVFSKATENANNIWSTDIQGNEIQLTQFGFTNQPPVANAGVDQTVECTGIGGTSVTLNGSASSDPDNDQLTYTWTGQFGTVIGPTPTLILPMGASTITLTVTDGKGAASSDEVIVNIADATPPSIKDAMTNPNLLWPPNHGMMPVIVNVTASDICSTTTACKIVSVNSNEPVNGLGDGDTAPDWEINGNLEVTLRAERAGTGNGRIYTITVQCTDASGNSATKDVVVTVPQSRSVK